MSSVTLRKRKLVDVFDKDFELAKIAVEPKTYIDRNGQKQNYVESILPKLRDLFPDFDDSRLKEVLIRNSNDVIGSIEDLKQEKKKQQMQKIKSNSVDYDSELVEVINNLKGCDTNEEAYTILCGLKESILADRKAEKKLEAENKILKMAYRIERDIGLENKLSKKKIEQELSIQQNNNQILLHKLMQLENAQNTVFNRNNDVF